MSATRSKLLTYDARQRTPLLTGTDCAAKRQDIAQYFQQTYALYEQLFTLLKNDEAFYLRADPLRHPLIFYYGHTAAFFINKLITGQLISKRINKQIESQFAVGADEMSWDDLDQEHNTWPSIQEIQAYRDKVYQVVNDVIATMQFSLPITWEDPAWIILMGIEHERIHLETTSVLIRQLPLHAVQARPDWAYCDRIDSAVPTNKLIKVPGGRITLGRSFEADTYGWDNEYGSQTHQVDSFAAGQYLVCNEVFKAFIESGGYQDKQWWTDEGWQWRCYIDAQMPRFWRQTDQDYRLRVLTEEINMPWSWPVEVNYLEAKAYCNWLAKQINQPIRLPTEAEWMLLRQQLAEAYPYWTQAPAQIDLAGPASPVPINRHQHGQFYDLIGNVWQWTETPFNPYHGFKVHPAYDDYSIPTFEGDHHLIKGGSWISTGNGATSTSRYAFRRHFYQHAGFRIVASSSKTKQTCKKQAIDYESDKLLSQYLELHYGPSYFKVDNYPQAIATKALSTAKQLQTPCKRALDIGCAVGRLSFELAKTFQKVTAVDFSVRFITVADQLQRNQCINYHVIDEGELTQPREIKLTDLGYTPAQIQRVQFVQGDACNLPEKLNSFDLVVASNLIDRLYDPVKFLQEIPRRINVGGLLVISSPYTWLSSHTRRNNWLGGFIHEGKRITTTETLKTILAPHFNLIIPPQDIPFVIRDTQRKYEYSVAQLTIWQRLKS